MQISVKALTRALEHISHRTDDVWFATPVEIANAAAEFPHLSV